jgi:hypothetical protein
MDTIVFRCADAETRRSAVSAKPELNAIDWLEVADLLPTELPDDQQTEYAGMPAGPQRDQLLWQRKLIVHFVNPLTAEHQAALSPTGILLSGGDRIPAPTVTILSVDASSVTLRCSISGDTSRYRIDVVRSAVDRRSPPGFDPLLSGVDFSFKVGCPTDLDCRQSHVCPTHTPTDPRLDYLARDYATFRRLMLDRLALLSPDWTDRSPADLGIALVELFAYVGDRLSYAQDAVATEAYLGTARLRKSVRRHARLVDYAMHDGCNARTWVQVRVNADVTVAPSQLRFLTRLPDLPRRIVPGSRDEATAEASGAQWFEPVIAELDRSLPVPPLSLFAAHNEIPFYDWGFPDFSVPANATEATLEGHLPTLTPGTVLVLAQLRSPETGLEADADPSQRHPVRLTAVEAFDGPNPLTDPLTGTEITRIAWAPADSLPFGLCVTTTGDLSTGEPAVARGAAALGNIVLADHGRTVAAESLGSVGAGRYRPTLAGRPLTQAATVRVHRELRRVRLRFDPSAPARAALDTAPDSARPELWPTSTLDADTTEWTAVPDLLDSGQESPELVAETEADGICQLRFGANGHGRPPRSAEAFTARYRHGNGVAGNIGADALGHVVTAEGRITGVRNPLPASGGTDPETIARVRRRAPEAFRTQQRAVTPGDYEQVAMRSPKVQRAAATMRWTGSWHTVFLTLDPAGATEVDSGFEHQMLEHVEPFRMAGHDLEIDAPRFVSLELALEVCVAADHFRSDVRLRLTAALSATDNVDGTRGLFHPDEFSFGQPVYLSRILAAAGAVAGVDSVRATIFQRLGSPSPVPLAEGRLTLGRLEIARLANDPDFPEHGTLRIDLHGGR